jgi:hypothetical protein
MSLEFVTFRKHGEGRRRKVPDGDAIRNQNVQRAIWREGLLQA